DDRRPLQQRHRLAPVVGAAPPLHPARRTRGEQGGARPDADEPEDGGAGRAGPPSPAHGLPAPGRRGRGASTGPTNPYRPDPPNCCSRRASTVVRSPIGVPPVSTVETRPASRSSPR